MCFSSIPQELLSLKLEVQKLFGPASLAFVCLARNRESASEVSRSRRTFTSDSLDFDPRGTVPRVPHSLHLKIREWLRFQITQERIEAKVPPRWPYGPSFQAICTAMGVVCLPTQTQ